MNGDFSHSIWSKYYLKMLIVICMVAAAALMVVLTDVPRDFFIVGSGVTMALFGMVCLSFFQRKRAFVNVQVAVSFCLLLLLIHCAFFFSPDRAIVQSYLLVVSLGYSLLLASPSQLKGYLSIQAGLIWVNLSLGHGDFVALFPFGLVYSMSSVFYYLMVRRMMNKQRELWLLKKEESEIRENLEVQADALQEYKYFSDLSTNLICIADLHGHFIDVNPAFVRLLGYSKAELLSKSYIDFIHPEDREKTLEKNVSICNGEPHTSDFVNRYLTKSGEIRYLQWNATAVPDRGKIYAVVQDITERKLAEIAVQAYQTRLQSLFEQETVGIALTTLDGSFVMTNPAIESILGYEKRELTSLRLEEVTLISDLHLLTDSIYLLYNGERNTFSYDQRAICKDGSLKWVRVELGILRSEQGEPAYLVCTLIDINDRKLAEVALKESEAYLQQAQGIANLGYWAVNLADMRPIWSEETFRIHDLDPTDEAPDLEEAIDFYDEDSRPIVTEAFTKCLTEGEPYDLTLKIVTAKGNHKWIRAIGEPEYQQKEVVKVFGIFQDITAQVEAAEQLKEARARAEDAARAKTMFLSNMSHEIRTPLNALIGSTHLLLQDDPRPDQKEMLEIMTFSGNNLMALVNDILDYSKIEAGKLMLESIHIDMKPFLQAIIQGHHYKAGEKNIDLKLDIAPDLPGMIAGDPTRITQVMNNLLSNALKFTDEGSVTLIAAVSDLTHDRCTLRLSVADTGIGIPQDQQEHIFGTFTQASTETTRKYGGTGLGLAISRNLVHLMGGRITLESEMGKGSVFTLEIEVPVVRHKATQHGPRSINTGSASLEGVNILLVEDNEVNVRIAQRFLTKWSATVTTASNGQEAVDLVREQAFDLVLMDIRMPVLGGQEATQEIRTFNQHTPIIALTASTLSEIRHEFEGIGFNGFVTKPFKPAELFSTIAEKVASAIKQR